MLIDMWVTVGKSLYRGDKPLFTKGFEQIIHVDNAVKGN